MQQGLLIDGDGEVTKRDMIPKITIGEENLSQPDSDENEDIAQMYANASRNISKRSTRQTSVQEDRSTSTTISGPVTWGKVVG